MIFRVIFIGSVLTILVSLVMLIVKRVEKTDYQDKLKEDFDEAMANKVLLNDLAVKVREGMLNGSLEGPESVAFFIKTYQSLRH